MRKLYVHVGLHKTGTSSIQSFFHEHRDHLRGYGFLYPLAGIVPAYPGHHNLAWELAGDRRFDSRRGTFSSLFSEVQAFDGDVLISSEDFEGVLGDPRIWTALREYAKRCGYVLRLVVFLREQAAYLESLFLQNLVLGCGECFSSDFEECLTHGAFRKRDWHFHFDYLKLITTLKGCGFDQLIVRDYIPDGSLDVIDAMCETVNLSSAAHAGLKRLYKNARRPVLDYLIRFHDNRFPAQRVVHRAKSLHGIGDGIGKLSMVPPLLTQIRDRFISGNTALAQEFNLSALTNWTADTQRTTESLSDIARVFSFETSLLLKRWFGEGRAAPSEYRQWVRWVNQYRASPSFNDAAPRQ